VVSVETVGPETRALGYTLEEGIVYYLIHGILHLLGFEHVDVDPEVASLMEKRQDELFDLVLKKVALTGVVK
jgi:rRNA maturation RNase YbeY